MTRRAHSRLRRSLEFAQRGAALMVLALLVACQPPNGGPPASQPATGAWSMFRGDLARDGHPAGATLSPAGSAGLALSERRQADGAVGGEPVAARGKIIVKSAGRSLQAF